jgi:hypothetical protein
VTASGTIAMSQVDPIGVAVALAVVIAYHWLRSRRA